MYAPVTTVISVEPVGETLSIVRVGGVEETVVANRREDGSLRWNIGDVVVYIPENTIVPEDVAKERGYWEEGAKKGMMAGGKGNRVKGRYFAKTEDFEGYPSRGLLFKAITKGDSDRIWLQRGGDIQEVKLGDNARRFFGLTEHVSERRGYGDLAITNHWHHVSKDFKNDIDTDDEEVATRRDVLELENGKYVVWSPLTGWVGDFYDDKATARAEAQRQADEAY